MNIALILAGGTGTRLGSARPKQYIEVSDKPIIAYCLEIFSNHKDIDKIQIVAEKEWYDTITPWTSDKFSGFSTPGKTRQLSIVNGLADILEFASDNDNVIIHDAARPFVTAELITGCINSLVDHEGVIPVLPMKDTIYQIKNNNNVALLDRSSIVAGQAPEAFRLGRYFSANYKLLPEKIYSINGSTEPAILDDMDIVFIEGDENNFKITTSVDLVRFKQVIGEVQHLESIRIT